MTDIVGLDALNAKLTALDTQVVGNLEVPVRAGLLLITNEAKRKMQDKGTHPQAQGNLARTIHDEVQVSGKTATGRSGTNSEYGRRHEFLAGHAFMRPAFDEKKDEAKQEVLDALHDLVAAAIGR